MSSKRCLWIALLLALPTLGVAQLPHIDWFTVDGGGGTSSNGQFSLAGTAAQPDAGAMNGGVFTLEGGFWSFVTALHTPGGPVLAISVSNHVVVVSWPAPAEGWRLRVTTALVKDGIVWSDIPPPYKTNSLLRIWFSETLPAGSRFYQLHKP